MCTALAVTAAVLAAAAWTPPLGAHGASRGLHLHPARNEVRPGGRLILRLHASQPFVEAWVAFVGEPAVKRRWRRPRRHAKVRVDAPLHGGSGVVNLHAEVRARDGKVFRASAIVRVLPPETPPIPRRSPGP